MGQDIITAGAGACREGPQQRNPWAFMPSQSVHPFQGDIESGVLLLFTSSCRLSGCLATPQPAPESPCPLSDEGSVLAPSPLLGAPAVFPTQGTACSSHCRCSGSFLLQVCSSTASITTSFHNCAPTQIPVI